LKFLLYLLSGLLLLSLPSLQGCGDEPSTRRPRRGRGATRSKTQKKKKKKAEVLDLSSLPERFRKADWSQKADPDRSRETRDPFLPYVEDLLEQKAEDKEDETKGKPKRSKVKLGNFDVQELSLISIISGGAVNKAMLTDPAGLGHIVNTGDVVGRIPMKVARITRNEVLFEPLFSPTSLEVPEPVRKALLTQEELEELLP